MPKGLTFLPSLALAAVMALPVAAQTQPDPDTVVARVNGDEITLGHMIATTASLPTQYQNMDDEVLYDFVLEQLIQQHLLGQVQDNELSRMSVLTLENEERSLRAVQTIQQVIEGAVTDEAIQAAYDAQVANFVGNDEFDASHILVKTEEEANTIKAQLDEGADFAELAKEKSTGPSGPNGGSLGWFGKGMMVPEFEQAVLGLEKGQVSAPVQTQFGWHVIKLNDQRMTQAPALADVREEVATVVRQDAVQAKIEELTEQGEVERPEIEGIGPEVLRQLDLIQE
ncbi:MAG: peptidylprolyl isomerase [Ruegeria sp.]